MVEVPVVDEKNEEESENESEESEESSSEETKESEESEETETSSCSDENETENMTISDISPATHGQLFICCKCTQPLENEIWQCSKGPHFLCTLVIIFLS